MAIDNAVPVIAEDVPPLMSEAEFVQLYKLISYRRYKVTQAFHRSAHELAARLADHINANYDIKMLHQVGVSPVEFSNSNGDVSHKLTRLETRIPIKEYRSWVSFKAKQEAKLFVTLENTMGQTNGKHFDNVNIIDNGFNLVTAKLRFFDNEAVDFDSRISAISLTNNDLFSGLLPVGSLLKDISGQIDDNVTGRKVPFKRMTQHTYGSAIPT